MSVVSEIAALATRVGGEFQALRRASGTAGMRSVSANATAVAGETLRVNATSGAITITPPTAPAIQTRVVVVKTDTSANTVTWNGTVNGDSQGVTLHAAGVGVGLVYDGAAWSIEYTTTVGVGRSGTGAYVPPAAGARNGTYNPHCTLYLPSSAALRALRGPIGRAGTGTLVDIVCAGDSRVAGTTFGPASSWPSLLRARLAAAGVPSAGTGLVPAGQGAGLLDARIALAGTWSNTPPSVNRTWGASGSTATFTPDAAGTIAEVYYAQGSGTFTVSINGGAATSVTPAAGSGVAKWTSAAQGSNITSVVVTATSSAGSLVGFCVRGTTGALVHNLGYSGFSTNTWVATGAGTVQPIVTLINPSVFGLMLGCNDQNGGVTLASYTSQMSTILSTNNAAAAKFIVAETPYNTSAAGWPAFVSAQYDLADSLGVPLLDLNDRWGTPAQGQAAGLLHTDQLHETLAGCHDIARAVAGLLTV